MSNFIENYDRSKNIIVSSDIVGVAGHPSEVLEFWSKVFGPNVTINLELIGWKWIHDFLNTQAGNQVAGIHGRTGKETFAFEYSFDWFKLVCLRQLLTPTAELLSKLDSNRYVLLHVPEVLQQFETIVHHYKTSANKPILFIENHPRPAESHDVAKALVSSLNSLGIPALVTIDLVHFIRGIDASVCLDEKLDMLIAELEALEKCMVHLPIGTLDFDSLPLAQIRRSTIAKIGEIINKHENIITLEHQLGSPIDQVLPPIPIAWRRKLQKRTNAVVTALIETGVLRFAHDI